jgi:hypothetical protein
MGTVTVRLSAETESAIDRAAREGGLTRSDFIRKALQEGVRRQRKQRGAASELTLFDRIKDVIGSCDSGTRKPKKTRSRLYEILMEKRKRSYQQNRKYYEKLMRGLKPGDTRRRRTAGSAG